MIKYKHFLQIVYKHAFKKIQKDNSLTKGWKVVRGIIFYILSAIAMTFRIVFLTK